MDQALNCEGLAKGGTEEVQLRVLMNYCLLVINGYPKVKNGRSG